MRTILHLSLLIALSESLPAQTLNTRTRNGSRTVFEGQPASIRLAPHVTTTIRLPEAVNSVVLGDSNLFQAEYSPKEPLLVFATPTASDIAESNLVISTVSEIGSGQFRRAGGFQPLSSRIFAKRAIAGICNADGVGYRRKQPGDLDSFRDRKRSIPSCWGIPTSFKPNIRQKSHCWYLQRRRRRISQKATW